MEQEAEARAKDLKWRVWREWSGEDPRISLSPGGVTPAYALHTFHTLHTLHYKIR
jgi:hypothetical protein